MNPSIKRLLGALLLIGTLGVSALMAVRSNAQVNALHIEHMPTITVTQPHQTGEHQHG